MARVTSEQDFRTRQDAETLVEAQKIQQDKSRRSKAMSYLRREQQRMEKVTDGSGQS